MLSTVLIAIVVIGASILLLGIKVFFVKNGKFPNPHVGGNEAMRKRNIGCVQSQDYEARHKPNFSIENLEKSIEKLQHSN